MKKKNKRNDLNEPVQPYNKQLKVSIFNSFDEMNHDKIEEMAKLNFSERLKFIKEVILKAYNETDESLRNRKDRKKIKFY